MDRRAYLGSFATAVTGLAGCLSGRDADGTGTATPTGTVGTPAAVAIPGRDELDLPVPDAELIYATSRDSFPAITDTALGPDWEGVELDGYSGDAARPRLADADRVVGVVREGEARAYPLKLLGAHEVVNDDFGGPLLVTFCSLCGSGVAAERVVDGDPALFGVSGRLWKSDLVLYDERTDSLWAQILMTAIRGERTGTRLTLVPTTLTTWGEWRETYPETRVVRPPPESTTIDDSGAQYYGNDRYEVQRESDAVGVGQNDVEDERLHPKVEVVGVVDGDQARAYPFPAVHEAGVVNDTVGDRPVVVAATDSTLVAYDRRVDGSTLSFERADDSHLAAGGSRWEILSGRAVDGSYEGTTLATASERSTMFWFAWVEFYPETDLFE